MLITEINRAGYQDGGLAAFKESMSIESRAAVAYVMEHAGKQESERGWLPDPRVIEFQQCKNRYGQQQSFQMQFHAAEHRWTEIAEHA